jgi:hypothetical protein
MKEPKFTILKKAYEVHDPTVWDNPYMIYPDEVYAETAGEAKQKCTDYNEFVNIRAKRVPASDLVLFEGMEISRALAIDLIEDKERFETRKTKMQSYLETDMFYIQNGYVGNSILWWALNGSGYTTDLNKAQKYSKAEVIKRFVGGRSEDKIWLSSHVEQNIRTHVDSQYLDGKYKV